MIVACSGAAGSGKSLVADYLRDRHGFRVVSFAGPLKAIAQQLWGFTDEQLYGPSEARSTPHATIRRPDGSPLTARVALQVLGTDVARQLDTSVWVRAAMAGIRDDEDVCIPDCRFGDELAAIRARGGYVIRRRSTKPITDTHPTEREMSAMPDAAFDACLGFEPSKAVLYGALDCLISGWRARTEVA